VLIEQEDAAAGPQPRRRLHHQLYFQVLFAITAGVLLGHFWPDIGAAMKPLGDAFIKLVKMIIAPVIFLTIVTGIAGMKDRQGRPGRVQGAGLFPGVLDPGVDRWPHRCQCRPAGRGNEHRSRHAG